MRPILLLLLAAPALAQTPECAQPPIEIPVQISGRPYVPPSTRATVKLQISACPQTTEPPAPPADILHGAPAPGGLLRGEGPGNLLTNRYETRVTIAK